ncbi:MAG: class I SAM-dependent methyltransferase [Chlorobi bacterium]|nr:class I SAM-dependent methyltransferase [Chlorobiota bacterium]
MKKSQIQSELWGKSPNGWAEIQEAQHTPLWEAMLNAAKVESGTTLLDVGCGSGGASILANDRGAEVYGFDITEGLLDFARRRVPKGKFETADIEELPYEDNMFDVVFAANSLQYSENRNAALQELIRVCKPTGQIIAGLFGAPEEVDFRVVFNALRDIMPESPKGGGPFEFSLPGKLEGLFAEENLTNIKTGEINCPFEYSSFDSFWYGTASAGPFQGILKVVSEDKLKLAVRESVNEFLLDDGRILIPKNIFKYVSATIN